MTPFVLYCKFHVSKFRVLANASRRVPDASKLAGTHRLSKWCVPRTRPNYPRTQLHVKHVISDSGYRFIDWRSHLSGGGINALPITPGRSGRRKSYLSSSLTFKLTDPSVLHNSWSNLKGFYLINTQDILRFFFMKSLFWKCTIWSMKSSFIYDQTWCCIHQSLTVKYIKN